ncbi:hypothetical protein GQ457_15G020410 [Hibiscus cannabinus]
MKMDTVGRANGAKYECLLFDLDDTLYPLSIEFMLKYLDIEESEVARMCLELYIQGALGYEFDNDDFHAYANGRLPYETLRPDPVLRNLPLSMPQRKIIFTNGDKAHAQQVVKRQRYGRAKRGRWTKLSDQLQLKRSHHTMQCHHAMHPTTTIPQAIGSNLTRQNQVQFHDSLNIPLRSNPRLTRGLRGRVTTLSVAC